MAISTPFSTFRSTKPSGNSTNVIRKDESILPTHTTSKQPAALDFTDQIRNKRMSITEGNTQTKAFEKKNKLKFFRRFSTRLSNKLQHTHLTGIDPTIALGSDPAPSFLLNKTISNDTVLVPSGFSFPTGDISYKSALHAAPKTSLSLTCDETSSLYCFKEVIRGSPTGTQCSHKSTSRASKFFRKRLSLSSNVLADSEEDNVVTQEVNRSPVEQATPTSLYSDDHPSSIMSSELSSANETGETSLASADDPESEECGLAGIGVRNRMSISLHSLPIRPGVAPQLAGPKPLGHSAMRYAPSSSSPLSSRLTSPPAHNHSSILTNRPSSRRHSSQSHVPRPQSTLFTNDHRMSFGHLSLVPNQTSVDSQTLMRILRGPSSYPEETLPRADSLRDSLYVSCV